MNVVSGPSPGQSSPAQERRYEVERGEERISQWSCSVIYNSGQYPVLSRLYIFMFFSFYFWKKNYELDLHNVDIVCCVECCYTEY